MSASVVVVGGGYGGVRVAKALDEVAEVILVEERDAFVHNVAALRGVVDAGWAERMFMPYDRLLRRGRVVRGRAQRVEPGGVTLASGEHIAADYVVLATGSGYPFPAKAEVSEAAGALERLGEARAALQAASSVLLLGAGPVGLEFAGEIKAVWPDKRVVLVEAGERILDGEVPEELRAEVARQLAELGVQVILGAQVDRELLPGGPGQAKSFTAALSSGAEVSADIWFQCFGAAPSTDCLGEQLAGARRADGLVEVQDTLQVVGQERVFALGDITALAELKKAKSAELHADVVVANIRALIEGGALTSYRPGGLIMALSLGPGGGAGYTPATGLLGARAVAGFKSGDLHTGPYEELLGVKEPAEQSA